MKIKGLPAYLLTLTLLAGSLTVPAWAKEFSVPDKHPVITVDFPDSWEPEETDHGVQGQSKDTAVYLAVEATKSKKGIDELVEEAFAMFKEHKLVVDESSKKEQKFQIAGEDAQELLYTGKDEDGPAAISLTFVPFGDTVVMITYWVSTESEAKHQPEITKIIKSIKKTE